MADSKGSRLAVGYVGVPAVLLLLLSCVLVPAAVHAEHIEEKPHFVLVHGTGHGAWCWYKVVTLLQEKGYEATAIDLTSAGTNKAIADDVQTVAQYLEPLTTFLANLTSNKVVMVGHSLGGLGVSYAMELFSSKIIRGVFLVCVMPKSNEPSFYGPILDVLAAAVASGSIGLHAGNVSNPTQATSIIIGNNTSAVIDLFYNLTPKPDITLSLSLLVSTPLRPILEILSLTPEKYGSIRRFYISTGKDHTFPPSIQASIIVNNPPERVFYLNESDHSAFFTFPKKLTSLLVKIAYLPPNLG